LLKVVLNTINQIKSAIGWIANINNCFWNHFLIHISSFRFYSNFTYGQIVINCLNIIYKYLFFFKNYPNDNPKRRCTILYSKNLYPK
jgi:hypothetical protein